ncbi:MAG: DUF3332 family protein [Planctomycetes bacterium]|nr:DUF3332 family protein [Planctomycetota bacterium]
MTRALFPKVVAALLAAVLIAAPGCYGPFTLTKQVHHWNGQVGEKWVNEVVFLVFVIIPVYGIATLGDAIIFNSIEFWTGSNPLEDPGSTAGTRPDGEEAVVFERRDGPNGRVIGWGRMLPDGGVLLHDDESGQEWTLSREQWRLARAG